VNASLYPHGTVYGYKNLGCRCAACTEAHRIYLRDARYARYARRVLVDGVWVAPVAADRHGLAYTYNTWGCRCDRCKSAANAERRRLAQQRAERQRVARGSR